jgi:hypothetical protein
LLDIIYKNKIRGFVMGLLNTTKFYLLLTICFISLSTHADVFDWRTVSEIDQRGHSLSLSKNELLKINEPDLYLFLSTKDINKSLLPLLEKKISTLKVKKVEDLKITNLKTTFIQQGIQLSANFEIQLKKPAYIFKGRLDGIAATAIKDNELVLLPAFINVDLKKVDKSGIKFGWGDILKPKVLWEKLSQRFCNELSNQLAKVVLNNFLENINAVAFKDPILWPINLNDMFGDITAKKLLKGEIIEDRNIKAKSNLHLNHVSFNISKRGIALLAQLSSVQTIGSDDSSNKKWSNKALQSSYILFNDAFTEKSRKLIGTASTGSEIHIRKSQVAYTINDILS